MTSGDGTGRANAAQQGRGFARDQGCLSRLSLARVLADAFGGRQPPFFAVVAAVLTALIMAVPLVYVLLRAAGGGSELWARLWITRIPRLLLNTVGLTGSVTALALLMGGLLAFLSVRTDIPGRRLWQVMGGVPLVFPPYIGAFVFIAVFGPRGLVETGLDRWQSAYWASFLRFMPRPDIYSFAGVTLVMALFTFPYVYLLVSAAMRSADSTLEEAARSSGANQWRVMRRVIFPVLRPALAAGGLLVALYVLSDFGAVSMLRYQSFTSAIYLQLVGRYDRSAAAALSALLMVINLTVYWGETRARGAAKYHQVAGGWRPVQGLLPLGRWRIPALGFVILVMGMSVLLPLASLAYWMWLGLSRGDIGKATQLWHYSLNSVWSAGAAASLAAVLALPVAYLSVYYPGPASKTLSRLAHAGYAIPGVVVALSAIFLFNRYIPWIYGTAAMVVAAYVLRFLPQGLQAGEAALAAVSPALEEAGRGLGEPLLRVMRRVTGPLILPGVLVGWSLMFVSSLKELPATLILRPPGFDTLAVRVWIDASEGFYTHAAPSAFLIVAFSSVPLYVLTKWRSTGARFGPS